MTDQTKPQKAPNMTALPFAPPLNGPFLENLTRATDSCAKACLAFQEEWFRFLASRFEWDSKVGQALASCKNLSEVVEVQRDWLQTAAQDYTDEAGRLARLAISLAPQWLPPRSYDPAAGDARQAAE